MVPTSGSTGSTGVGTGGPSFLSGSATGTGTTGRAFSLALAGGSSSSSLRGGWAASQVTVRARTRAARRGRRDGDIAGFRAGAKLLAGVRVDYTITVP